MDELMRLFQMVTQDMDSEDDAVLSDLSELVHRSMVLFDERTFRYRLHDLMKPIAEGLFA